MLYIFRHGAIVEDAFMKTSFKPLLLIAAFAAYGCAAPQPQDKSKEPSSQQEIGAPGAQARDPLQSKCRVPCSVSPGPGCC